MKNKIFKVVAGLMIVSLLPLSNSQVFFKKNLLEENKIKAATVTSGTLIPGQNSDTGNHSFDTTFQQDPNNWQTLAGSSNWWKWDPSNNNYFWLANSVKNSWVYHMVNASIDFSKPITITTPYWYDRAAAWLEGDAAGFILTPTQNAGITANAPNATGQLLGINGLPNSVFIGRDLYYNAGFDGPTGTNKGQNILEIRKTDPNGVIEQTNTSTLPWAQIAAPLQFQGSGNTQWSSETQTMNWTNIVDNQNGTYTGTLSITSTPASGYNNNGSYVPVTTSRTLTLNKNMNFGSLAITGNNTGVIQEGNASTNANFSATRGTVTFPVNYINSTINQPIKNVRSSTITANVQDTIGVANGIANTTDNYTYNAPIINGYTFSSGASIDILSYNEYTETNPNNINVYYTPNPSMANFKWSFVGTGAAPSLPSTITQNGVTDASIVEPNLPNLPTGYAIQDVIGPDGLKYSNVSDALAAGSNGFYSATGNSNFIIEVKMTAPLEPTFDSAPILNFGTPSIQAGVGHYPVVSQSTDLQVTDDRAVHSGWKITVAMNQQFTSDSSVPETSAPIGTYLKGASIDFKPGLPTTTSGNSSIVPTTGEFQLLGDGAEVLVMSAAQNEGSGEWKLPFKSITLDTLDSAIRTGVKYTAQLTWTLSDTPN